MSIDKAAYFEQVGYTPHPKQWLFHNSDARFRVASCGRRWGKSTAAGREMGAALFLPKKRYWIVGPTYDLGEKEFRPIWDDLIVGQGFGKDKRVQKAYNKRQGNMYIEFPWGTRVEVRSADHASTLVGERLDGVILSEAAKHPQEVWERYIRPGLADAGGWAIFPSTPEGHNWFYELWRLGQNPDHPDYASWRFPSWENSHVFPGGREDPEIRLLEDTSSKEWFDQEIGAEFTSFVGRIFHEFDEQIHVKPVPYDPNLSNNYIAFDWGHTKPLAAVEFQVTPLDQVRVWRQHYKAGLILQDHIEIMKARPQPEGYRQPLCFGDCEDPGAVEYVSRHFAPCLSDPMVKQDWRKGIELMKRFLKPYPTGLTDEYGTPLEEPKLVIDYSCSDLIREFGLYRTRNNAQGKEMTGSVVAPGVDDHALDALRYGLMHIFEIGINHLTDVYSPSDFATDSYEASDEGIFTAGMKF